MPQAPAKPDAKTKQAFDYRHARLFTEDELATHLALHTIVAVDCTMADDEEGDKHVTVVTLAWSTGSATKETTKAWVVHDDGANTKQLVALMRTVLSSKCVKVVHDVYALAHRLMKGGLNDAAEKLIDLQLFYEQAIDNRVRDAPMTKLLGRMGVPETEIAAYNAEESEILTTRELNKHMIPHKVTQCLSQRANMLLALYTKSVMKVSDKAQRKQLMRMSVNRWDHCRSGGTRAFWFNAAQDFLPRSIECFGSHDELTKSIPRLQLECEIDSLLDLLPQQYRDAIQRIENATTTLVDVCLDIGRVPHGYAGRGQRVTFTTESPPAATKSKEPTAEFIPSVASVAVPKDCAVVDKEVIDSVLERLGGQVKIGDDNRAGVDGQLHRISVMRTNMQAIYGVTMRVGRTLRHSSNYLLDLLMSSQHKHKSVLLLGKPGSGKTTLIRDIARCISESGENVCIIDTSNEIGGDGTVPHACIGWARRMMVKTLNDQARVMVECVQNHTVETLIIDEIGRGAEVQAASTVKQRGPRLIASAHGDLRSLIKNQELRGLVGGIQSVTVGDAAAKKGGTLRKFQSQRLGTPVFDVIVEIDEVRRGQCRIIWDVAQAVDDVLDGKNSFKYEVRYQSFDLLGVSHEVPS